MSASPHHVLGAVLVSIYSRCLGCAQRAQLRHSHAAELSELSASLLLWCYAGMCACAERCVLAVQRCTCRALTR